MGKLDGKVAIVTGAARGLGRAYAKRLAELGAARLRERMDCDVNFDELAAQWQNGIFEALESLGSAGVSPAGDGVPPSRTSEVAQASSLQSETDRKLEARATFSRKNPFPARLLVNRKLTGEGSEKDTRHIVLAAAPGALAYQVGDSLGVVACNCPELVGAIVARLGAKPDTQVLSPDGVERPLSEALSRFSEIRRPSDQAIEVLASRAHDLDESRTLQAMAEGYPSAGPDDADLLDLLECFPSARPPLSELISALDPLQPRFVRQSIRPKLLRLRPVLGREQGVVQPQLAGGRGVDQVARIGRSHLK